MYGGGLVDKPRLTVLNKVDAVDGDEVKIRIDALSEACGEQIMSMSGATGHGVTDVLRALRRIIRPATPDAREDGPWSPV